MIGFRPLGARIAVTRIEAEQKTASGIVLPGAATEKPDVGLVVAIGNGHTLPDGSRQPLEVHVGDTVVFGKYAGQTVKVDGKDLLVMPESDVLGVLD